LSPGEALTPAGATRRVWPELEPLGTARGAVRRSGRDGARTPELPAMLPPGLGRETAEPPVDPPEGLELVVLPPPELPPEPPEGRETAEPLLLPPGFGRAPDDWPLSCASTGRANAIAVAVKTDVKARRFITAPILTQNLHKDQSNRPATSRAQ